MHEYTFIADSQVSKFASRSSSAAHFWNVWDLLILGLAYLRYQEAAPELSASVLSPTQEHLAFELIQGAER